MTARVKISMFPDWPLERQLPGRDRQWGEFEFFVNEPIDEADFWVVSIGLYDAEKCVCPPDRTLFVTYEPSSVHRYEPDFLNQFAAVLTCQRRIKHPGVIYGAQGQLWYAGVEYPDLAVVQDHDSLSAMKPPAKTGRLSLISSRKTMTAEHERRVRLVDALQDRLGNRLQVFGNGYRQVPDKLNAILPFRYHLVLENSREPDYWSEKLADAFLGWAHPIYLGCPNIQDYFAPNALTVLDNDDPQAIVDRVEAVLAEDPYEARLPALAEARRTVLTEQNFFGRLAEVLRGMSRQPAQAPRPVVLRDERHFVQRPWLAQSVRNTRSVWRRMTGRNLVRRG